MNGPTEHDEWSELRRIEDKLREEVHGYPPPKLTEAARWIERTYDLRRRLEIIRREVAEQLQKGTGLLTPANPTQPQELIAGPQASSGESAAIDGGKARGRECRSAYIAQQTAAGQTLLRVRGALYKNPSGVIVGIAYAKERKNEWFLGLPAGEFQEAVLLCETNDSKVQPILLPKGFVETHQTRLSVSSQYNQTKFKVARRAGRYCLIVGGQDVDLTDCLAGPPFVCPRHEYQ
jgi:hypothetical protein